MATTYNFTVRAEDNEGAFADRDFSIVVRNTAVDRYLYIDSTDAYTSNDFENWTRRVGQGGVELAYGGGMWLIMPTAGSGTFRRTYDGVSFDSVSLAGPIDPRTGAAIAGQFNPNAMPQFHNGYWWVTCTQSSNSYILRSPDAASWTLHAVSMGRPLARSLFFQENTVLSGVSTAGSSNYVEFPYDDAGEGTVHELVAKNSGAVSHGSVSSGSYGYVSPPININGIYVRTIGYNGTSGRLEYSRSANSNWVVATIINSSGQMQSNAYDRLVYANGLFIMPGVPTSSSGGGLRPITSIDGRTWTQLSLTSSVAINQPLTTFTRNGTTYFMMGAAQVWTTSGDGTAFNPVPATDLFPSAPRAIAMAK